METKRKYDAVPRCDYEMLLRKSSMSFWSRGLLHRPAHSPEGSSCPRATNFSTCMGRAYKTCKTIFVKA